MAWNMTFLLDQSMLFTNIKQRTHCVLSGKIILDTASTYTDNQIYLYTKGLNYASPKYHR